MGLLQRLKSALGLERAGQPGTTSEPSPGQSTDVTVEREPSTDSEPATETEDAVKGTETAADTSAESDTASADEGVGVAADSVDDSADAAEPAELDPAAEADAEADVEADVEEDVGTTVDQDAEAAVDAEADAEPAAEPEAADGSDEAVTEIKGIGPAYGDRLAGAGVDTVGELAAADAEELAAEIDVSEKRVGEWIDRAQSR